MFPSGERNSYLMIIIMEISTAPYLLKILQPKAHTKAIQTTITSHRHTHMHTLSHTSSFKNYMSPKYTYQKAENQTTGASFALSHSLSFSPPPASYIKFTNKMSMEYKSALCSIHSFRPDSGTLLSSWHAFKLVLGDKRRVMADCLCAYTT